jgi:hypothetical protein
LNVLCLCRSLRHELSIGKRLATGDALQDEAEEFALAPTAIGMVDPKEGLTCATVPRHPYPLKENRRDPSEHPFIGANFETTITFASFLHLVFLRLF